MSTIEQQHAVAYHYSPVYRQLVASAIDAAGLAPRVFDDPEAAQEQLDGSEVAVIAPHELYVPAENGKLAVVNPADNLVRYAELFDTPWALLSGPTVAAPFSLLANAPKGSIVLLTGEEAAWTAEQRVAQANAPEEATRDRVASALTTWLTALQKDRI